GLVCDGVRYLVAPRGEAHWVRNLRAARAGELRLGRRSEPFRAVEVADADKPPILRAYLERWRFEVDRFFEGLGQTPSDDDLRRVAGRYPGSRFGPAGSGVRTWPRRSRAGSSPPAAPPRC